jgi:hypothetical protein
MQNEYDMGVIATKSATQTTASAAAAAAAAARAQEPYKSVMQKVYDMGVIATKSAGNQGLPAGQGLFWVDAYTGAGSITVASVDTSNGVVGQLASSDFSTYGPVSDFGST